MSDTPAFLKRREAANDPAPSSPRPPFDGDSLLEGLTPPQKEAVLCTEGPLLVLAAAGSGKTRVITRRIAYLISCGVPAWQILALTFTNKAAGEMRERVHKILGDQVPSRGLTITTFHSLCARLLRRYAQPAGLKPDFSIYDSSDQSALCKKVIESLQLSTSNFPPRSVLSAISNAKNDLKDAQAFAAEAFDFSSKIIAKVYAGYTKALRAANAVDFDDLLLLTAKVLKEDALAREECQKRWQYVLVDEYQDTNHAQFLIASLIAGEGAPGGQGPNFCVVGDPDQCLLPGSPIATPDGTILVEQVRSGQTVVSGSGCGRTSAMPVNHAASRQYDGPVVLITTESGEALRATPNHILFAKLRAHPDVHYIYLMWKRGVGYRIGTTRGVRASKQGDLVSGLQVRSNQEVADAMWVLRTSTSVAEARFYEHFYSVQFGIPTMVFFVRGRRMEMTQDWIDRLYKDIDSDAGAERLMAHLHLDIRYPHHRPGAVTRSGKAVTEPWSRKHVLFTVFGDMREHTVRPWNEHRVQLVTSDLALRRSAEGRFKVREGVRGTWRIETSRKDYEAAQSLARQIADLDPQMDVVPRARLSPAKAFSFMPASHIHPGMIVPVLAGREIVERIVSSVDWVQYAGPVYDLSVPNTRNYVAGGIVVHNSIYGWRGADISNILDFEEHYPKARTITLGENFRSTAPILKVADTLIRHNKRRKHKDLFTSKQGGQQPEAVLTRDEHHESSLVVNWFKQLHEEAADAASSPMPSAQSPVPSPIPWRDMAVFYRTNSLSRVIEEALRSAAIPYTIARGTAFYDREEIKNVLAYLRVVANGADGVSLSRIINTPARGISDKTIDSAEVFAMQHFTSLLDALRSADQLPGLNPRAVASIAKFIETLHGWTGGGKFLYAGSDHSLSLAELVDRIIKESGLEAMYKKQAATSQTETDSERLDNLAEMVSSAREFELEYDPDADPALGTPALGTPALRGGSSNVPAVSPDAPQAPPKLLVLLRAYLESVALVADADAVNPSQGSVTLMTLHAAKGLEFKAVAMIGMEEGLLPHTRAFDSEADLEEERRLCFVGVTRAMQRLLLTSAKYRTIRGLQERTIPSRFLGEMPHDTLHVSDQSDTLADLGEEWGSPRSESFDIPGNSGRALGAPRRHSTPAPGSAGEFPVGAQVRHPQFGIGTIKSVQPGANARATIQFRDVGTKTLVLEYARLTRVS